MFEKIKSNYLTEMLDAGYNPDDENNSYQTKIFPKLIPTLIENSNPKCLDIGTAQGHVPICLYKRGIKNWDVIDYDDIYFSDFSDKYGFKCHKVDVEKDKFPFKEETFDLIFICEVIEHISDSTNLLIECKRILRKDGILVITTPDISKIKEEFYEDPTHVKPFIKSGLSRLLRIIGFSKFKVSNFGTGGYRKFHPICFYRKIMYKFKPLKYTFFGTHIIAIVNK